MRVWAMLLGGLIVWTAHFFAVYGIASIFPGTSLARWLTIAVTLPALAVTGWLLWLSLRQRRSDEADSFDRWTAGLAALGNAVGLIAVAYQGLPAILA